MERGNTGTRENCVVPKLITVFGSSIPAQNNQRNEERQNAAAAAVPTPAQQGDRFTTCRLFL